MTDRLLHETRISLTLLAQEQKKSVQTCWRWTGRGLKGHVLESFSVGGRRYTTREAFCRWIARLNAENGSVTVRSETPRQRQVAIEQAEQRAKALGV